MKDNPCVGEQIKRKQKRNRILSILFYNDTFPTLFDFDKMYLSKFFGKKLVTNNYPFKLRLKQTNHIITILYFFNLHLKTTDINH